MAELLEDNTFASLKQSQSMMVRPGFTNNVFCVKKKKTIVYYLPVYLRLKLKNIVSMDLFTLSGEVNCTFIMSIYYADMQQKAFQFMQKSVEVSFHKSGAFVMDANDINVDKKKDTKKRLLTFTIRKSIPTRLQGDIFWSPFETVKFVISLTMRTLKTQMEDESYVFKFNLMDCEDKDTKFSLADQWGYGMFKIAENQLEAEYTNKFAYSSSSGAAKRKQAKIKFKSSKSISCSSIQLPSESTNINQAHQDEAEPLLMRTNINNFQYAHFVLPAYKKPNATLLTIFFPLLLLGVINISIFFQDVMRTGKIQLNICALIVSFIALVPTVRQNTAISPTLTFTQMLVFLESFTTILTLIHMLRNGNDPNYVQIVEQDGLILACIIITSFVASCVLTLSLTHKFYWKRKYHRTNQTKKSFKFQHRKWFNQACDLYFAQHSNELQNSIVHYNETEQTKPKEKKAIQREEGKYVKQGQANLKQLQLKRETSTTQLFQQDQGKSKKQVKIEEIKKSEKKLPPIAVNQEKGQQGFSQKLQVKSSKQKSKQTMPFHLKYEEFPQEAK